MATVETTPDLGRARARLVRRGVVVTMAAAAVAFALFVVTLMFGSVRLSVAEVLGSLTGLGDDPSVDFIVRDLRMSVAATALLVGAALGISGLLFQKLLANPLASPDFVGVTSGASLFVVTTLVVFPGSGWTLSMMALIGAVVSSALIYLLAWRDGITGFRFILIGIGVAEFFMALTGFLIAKADLFNARAAMTWLVGSVGHAGRTELWALVVVLAIGVPAALVLGRPLRALELGDDAATALGARVEWCRIGLLAVAIVFVGFAVAAAGPIPFVALIAGPIARRMLGPVPGGILAAGFVGAAIVLASDYAAAHLLPTAMPTGVVTGLVGAPYLIWLLIVVNREGRGG